MTFFFLSFLVALLPIFFASCGQDEVEEEGTGPFSNLMEGRNPNQFSFVPKSWITTQAGKYKAGQEMLLGSGEGIAAPWRGQTVTVRRVDRVENLDKVSFEGILESVDQDTDLEFREDLWYLVGGSFPFTGVAFSYYPETKTKKSRTVIVDGLPKGVIDEWQPDGTRKGGGFADDFERDK